MWGTGARRGERDGDRAWMEWRRVESDGGDSLSLSTLCCEVNYEPGACCRGASRPLACRCPAIATEVPVRHRLSPTVLLIAAALLTLLVANGQGQAPRRSTDARQVGVVVWRDRLEIVFPPLPFASSTCDGSDRRA